MNLRLALITIALCTSSLAGRAQQSEITVNTKPTSSDIQTWLDSGDPRLIAWGAYFARENHDADGIVPMLHLVESWTPPNEPQDAIGHSQIDAMGEVLDTMIQLDEHVSPAGLNAIASSFPRQVMILASRLPLAEAKPFLLTWYEKRNNNDLAAFSRIAAMLLAKSPPPGFAASVLAESEEELNVMVENDWLTGHGYAYGISGGCGDGWGLPSPKGWPPFFDYEIEENNRSDDDPVIVEAGGDRITYHRFAMNRNRGSGAFVHPLNAETRHRLIAEMLGITEEEIGWRISESGSIVWENGIQFTLELQNQVVLEEVKLYTTAKALYEKGLLSKAESESVRPKLSITVLDYRKPIDKPLPHLQPSDTRTTVTYKQPTD